MIDTLTIVAYLVVLLFFSGALVRTILIVRRLKQRDLLALMGLLFMTLIYSATLLNLVVALLSPASFNGPGALYVLMLAIFLFSILYYWTSPTFPLRRNRLLLTFMGIVTSISVVIYVVLFFLFVR